MAIETVGGKYPYVVMVRASMHRNDNPNTGVNIYNNHGLFLTVADSDDEAIGKGLAICEKVYPKDAGWRDHYQAIKSLGGIESLGHLNVDSLKPEPRPW